MPTLVHIAPEKCAKAIRRSGIRAGPACYEAPTGVFCMPMLPDYLFSHQWLRELKRQGQRTLVAITFRLRSDEPVWFGHYSRPHKSATVGETIGTLMRMTDAWGFEIVVPRSIQSNEIIRVRTPRQVTGWRYHPGANGTRPCPCRVCLPKGTIKSRRLRRQLDPTGENY